MALTPNQITVINNSDRSTIQDEFVRVAQNWKKGRWLSPGNRYAKDTIGTLKAEKKAGTPVNNAQLRQYIAASSATHCMDGWSYLGKAISAHIRGDGHVARHLGYYSELRATMALLAAEGIGVFDQRHFIVDGNRKCNEIPKPPNNSNIPPQRTHVFTWEAVEHWASQSSAADLIFDIIKPGGLPLNDWLTSFGILGGFRSIIAAKWLSQWGLDLRRIIDDREARNLVSYRPTAFLKAQDLSPSSAVKLVKGFWRAYEPQSSIRFPELDKYLLKNSLEFYFQTTHPHKRTHRQARQLFERQLKSMLHTLSPRGLAPEAWLSFLLSSNENILIEEAKGSLGPEAAKHHMQVIARASLLLRLATGACQNIVGNIPGLTKEDAKDDTQFWWTGIGEHHCLWHKGLAPAEFVDLWADINEALDDLERWEASGSSGEKSYYRLSRDMSGAVNALGTCERIGLWGLGI